MSDPSSICCPNCHAHLIAALTSARLAKKRPLDTATKLTKRPAKRQAIHRELDELCDALEALRV
jgi:hypothetical protein